MRDYRALTLVLLSSFALFWLVSRDVSLLNIDSGPYLSMAYHVATEGAPRASFNFVSNFERLPSYPNFIPPGIGLLVGLGAGLARSLLAGGRIILAASLFVAHLAAFTIVARATRRTGFALVVSVLVVWHPAVALWAAQILSELP